MPTRLSTGMLHILLGIIDLLAALTFCLAAIGYPLPHLQAAAGLALLLKGGFYISDILSVVDVCLAILLFWLFWTSMPLAALSAGVYLAFKGLYTFA